jgi:8-amino-3,8-dideoxy-alpha-D-manno-octulosonate transaminase
MPGFEWLGEEELAAVTDVMKRKVLFRYEFGPQRGDAWRVKEFEEAFAKFCGAKHAIAVSSGSAALKVALAAMGVGAGDEVITQGYTFVATWEAILECGAKPVFCEINESMCMDPADLQAKITDKTKCVVPVHMCGAQACIEQIVEIANQHGVPVLEDTAQAAGCTLGGKHVGTFGQMGTFSFDAVKTLTTGEGGMVITDNEELWRNASEYHDHGHDHKPVGRGNEGRRFIGFNYRMMELQGALGLAQLKKLPGMIETQRRNKAFLKEALKQIPGATFRELPDESGDSATFITWYMPTAEATTKMAELLAKHGAAAVPWGVNTWHNYEYWEHLHNGSTSLNNGWPFKRPDGDISYPSDALPKTKAILDRCLSWQIMLNWDQAQLDKMAEAVKLSVAEM